jgi:hypothetical protein
VLIELLAPYLANLNVLNAKTNALLCALLLRVTWLVAECLFAAIISPIGRSLQRRETV